MKDEQYFAAKPPPEFGSDLISKVDDYFDWVRTNGVLSMWRRSYRTYYKPFRTLGQLGVDGDKGQFTTMNVNHYRNLLQHLLVMVTQQRPWFEPMATNTDYKSQAQTVLARGLLEYYLREKRMDRVLKTACEFALTAGEGYVTAEWDATFRNPYAFDPGTRESGSGDIAYAAFHPSDVIRNVEKLSAAANDWYAVRKNFNRHILAAAYPEQREKIMGLDRSHEERDWTLDGTNGWGTRPETDEIPVYDFYHIACPALPGGRAARVLPDGTVIMDGPMPYRKLPIYRISGGELHGSPFGYTVGYDLLNIQEGVDILYSTVISNQEAFGVQSILMPTGNAIHEEQLTSGLRLIEFDPKAGPPQPLQLLRTPPEIFNFIGQCEKAMETISGVNSVARGDPAASLKSGAALALVASQAIQFSMGLQASWNELLEDVGTATIEILRVFAKEKRVALIAGKNNRTLLREFDGEELSEISRVTVDQGNPMNRTTAGRANMADALMEKGLIENPDQYIQLLQTGRIEHVLDGKQKANMSIQDENEHLMRYEDVPVLTIDNHKSHIIEHSAIIAAPQARYDDRLVEVTMRHIDQHLQALREADPLLIQLIGQESAAVPLPGVGGNSAAGVGIGQQMDATLPVQQEAGAVNEPNMPTNPLTGGEYQPGLPA